MSKNNPTKPMSKTYYPGLTRGLAERMFEVSMENGESLSMAEAVRVADDFCADPFRVADAFCADSSDVVLTPYQIAAARAVANFRSMADYVLNAFESDDPRPDEDSWAEAKRFIMEIDTENLTDEADISAKHGTYKLQVTFGDPVTGDGDEVYVSGHDADTAYETAVQLVKLTRSGGAVELFRNGRSLRRFTTDDNNAAD